MPHPARDSSATAATAATAAFVQPTIARAAVRRTILLVAINVVRNLVVDEATPRDTARVGDGPRRRRRVRGTIVRIGE
jgi:hypothetical protein